MPCSLLYCICGWIVTKCAVHFNKQLIYYTTLSAKSQAQISETLNFVYVPEKWHDFKWKFYRRIILNLLTLKPIWYILNTLRYNERRHLPMAQFDLDDEDNCNRIYTQVRGKSLLDIVK